jgi:hypothetical protein
MLSYSRNFSPRTQSEDLLRCPQQLAYRFYPELKKILSTISKAVSLRSILILTSHLSLVLLNGINYLLHKNKCKNSQKLGFNFDCIGLFLWSPMHVWMKCLRCSGTENDCGQRNGNGFQKSGQSLFPIRPSVFVFVKRSKTTNFSVLREIPRTAVSNMSRIMAFNF